MRGKRAILAILLVLAAGGAYYLCREKPRIIATYLGLRKPEPGGPLMAQWEPYGYEFLPHGCDRNFNLRFALKGDRKAGAARVLVNVQDEQNYYFVEFAEGVRIGRVLDGAECAIGSPAGASAGREGWTDIETFVLERRPSRMALVGDRRVLVTAAAETFSGGRLAFGSLDHALSLKRVRCQRIGEVYFEDCFMRAATDQATWQTEAGEWNVEAVRNRDDEEGRGREAPVAGFSANYFSYTGRGRPQARSVTGAWFWDDYRLQLACRPRGKEALGIYFCYADVDNCFLFRWGGRGSDRPEKELVRRVAGRETVLARRAGGHVQWQWYQITIRQYGTCADVMIDDTPVFSVRDPYLSHGKIGLYACGQTGADFDDVLVRTAPAFFEDFSEKLAGRWSPVLGDWDLVVRGSCWGATAADRFLYAMSPQAESGPAGAARLISRRRLWRDSELAVDVGPWAEGTAGVCFGYRDEDNYYAARMRKSPAPGSAEVAVTKVSAGRETRLARGSWPQGRAAGRHRAQISIRDGHIILSVDRARRLEAWDPDLGSGRAGLIAEGGAGIPFDNVSAQMAEESIPILSRHRAFSHETSMDIWAGALSDWEQRLTTFWAGRSTRGWWHRADFFGDLALNMKIGAVPEKPWQLALVAGAQRQDMNTGYALHVTQGKVGQSSGSTPGPLPRSKGVTGRTCSVRLLRLGKVVDEARAKWDNRWHSARLQRLGPWVLGFLGSKRVVLFRDPEPLAGTRIGWAAEGFAVAPANLEIYSDHQLNYTFRSAPTDWRVGSGTWQVTNRWQCDPRWSFFSGRSDGVAALWNKRGFNGDVTLDFYVGPMMQQRLGKRYTYVSNFNATLCADGRHLNSGYSFVFGGDENRVTRIYRKGKVLAETRSVRIQTKGLHRRWYHVTARKRGKRLELRIDDRVVLQCEDPEPLSGGQMAIWTFQNGIMVARVRVAATEITKRESPDIEAPKICRSIYSR